MEGWLLATSALTAPAFGLLERFDGLIVQHRGVKVIETFKLVPFDLLIKEAFNCFGVFKLVCGEDGERVTFFFGTSSSADTVDVVLGIFWNAVVDDVGNV